MTMTPRERLEAMLARSEKATKGPWFVLTSRDVFPAVIVPGKATIACDFINETDADFAAASRTDLPATVKCLLAVMDRCVKTSDPTQGESGDRRLFALTILAIINRELAQ